MGAGIVFTLVVARICAPADYRVAALGLNRL